MPQFGFLHNDVRKWFVDDLGLRQQWIDEAIATPDQVELLAYDDLTLKLYAKNIGGRRPSVLVVITKPDVQLVSAVLRLYNDFDRDIHDCTPLELVEMVARRFGVTIKVGTAEGRFFLKQDVPLAGTDPTNFIGLPSKPVQVTTTTFLRRSPGPPPVLNCALVFALDLAGYRSYLMRP